LAPSSGLVAVTKMTRMRTPAGHGSPTPHLPARAALGRAAEERAAHRLRQAGFTVLARNYRCRGGELDIVARRAELLVIAEVRLRSSTRFGGPAASVTTAKRRRIVHAARHLLARQPWLARLAIRFDVLATHGASGPIEWIEGAFDASPTT
jgi:putative endonuclease